MPQHIRRINRLYNFFKLSYIKVLRNKIFKYLKKYKLITKLTNNMCNILYHLLKNLNIKWILHFQAIWER